MWLVWIKILRLQNLNFEMFRTFVWKQRHGTFRVRLFWTIENFPLIFMPRVVFVTEHLQNRSAWNQVLESHHLISSFISQVSISRSRYWPRWNCRLNILDCRTRKAEVLNSLIINTTAKANDTTDILLCTEDDNSCYRNVCKMSVVSFALAVVFIIGLSYLKLLFQKVRMLQRPMALTTAHFYNQLHLSNIS